VSAQTLAWILLRQMPASGSANRLHLPVPEACVFPCRNRSIHFIG